MSRYHDGDDDRRRRSSSHGRGRDRRDSYSGDEPYPEAAGIAPPYMTTAFAPPPNASNPDLGRSDSLQVPSSGHRPRSQPPASASGRSELSRRGSERSHRSSRSERGDDSDDSDYDRDRDYDRERDSRSPLGKVKHVADKTFSTSTSGIGASVLGAIVGGFAAHEASEAATRARDKRGGRDHRHQGSKDHQRAKLISTIVGAAVGGLGANAIEKRIEHRRRDSDRDRDRDREHKPREIEYSGSGGSSSRAIRDRSRGRGGSDDGSSDDDDGWESGASRSSRGRRSISNRNNLVISRSPSAEQGRSHSRNPPQHGGTADAYYSSSRGHDDRR